jgi:hypothetical protein
LQKLGESGNLKGRNLEKTMQRNIFIFLAVLGGACCAGCESNRSQEFNWRTFRFEAVGPRERPQKTVAKEGELDQIPPPAQKTSAQMTSKQKKVYEKGEINRLYIGDATASKDASADNLYIAKQTTPDKLAELLTLLYPGQGPGGSDRLRFLLYSDETTWEKAKAFAPRLDVAAQQIKPDGTPVVDTKTLPEWDLAIGLIYGSEFPRRVDPDIRVRVISLLNHVLEYPSAQADLRWGAAIISSNLNARFDPKDYIAASATLSQGLRLTGKQDYKAMVIRYHHIKQLLGREQKLTARKQAQDFLNYFQNWDTTDCYHFVQTIVEQK